MDLHIYKLLVMGVSSHVCHALQGGAFCLFPDELEEELEEEETDCVDGVVLDTSIWENHKVLKVFFQNEPPFSWSYNGVHGPVSITKDLVLKWANVWSDGGSCKIPKFIEDCKRLQDSDIRVKFAGESTSSCDGL